MDEKQLIQACAKADANAQRALYDNYGRSIMGLCLRYAGNREDAEEVFHDAMLRVFQGIGKFHGKSTLKTWLHRIAVNTAIDFLRKRKNALIVEHLSEEALEIGDTDLENDTSLDAEIALKNLQQLPQNQQIIVNLFIIDGFSHKEIAQHLGISEEASRSTVRRARKTLVKLTQIALQQNEKNQLSK